MSKIPPHPHFSILIANYNNGGYLESCLQSIFAQTYGNWEVVIVDDGSTDTSDNVYKKYSVYDQIKIFKNHQNKGCGYTKRKCIEHARGEICGFLDADDALASDALEIMARQHLDHPDHSIVYSTHYICNNRLIPEKIASYVGQIPPGERSLTLITPAISHFATFKMSKYKLTEGISEAFLKAVDKDLYYKLEEVGLVLYIDKPLYFYRLHSENISLNKQTLAAGRYELAAKALSLLRQDNPERVMDKMPYSVYQLIGGLAYVAYCEVKYLHLKSSFRFISSLTSFFFRFSGKFFQGRAS